MSIILFHKIKKARSILKLNQADFAKEVGASQKDVSLLEKGKNKFIPNKYIIFLLQKGFDLNSLFDDSRELSFIEDINTQKNIAAEPTEQYLTSKNEIEDLKNKVEDLLCFKEAVKLHLEIDELIDKVSLEKKSKTYKK